MVWSILLTGTQLRALGEYERLRATFGRYEDHWCLQCRG
jgi:hypothetical protein